MANSTAPTKQTQVDIANIDLWNRLLLENPEVKLFTTFRQWQDWQKEHTDWPTHLWEYKDQALQPMENEETEEKDTDKRERREHGTTHAGPLPDETKDKNRSKDEQKDSSNTRLPQAKLGTSTKEITSSSHSNSLGAGTEKEETDTLAKASFSPTDSLPQPNITSSQRDTKIYEDIHEDPSVADTENAVTRRTNLNPRVMRALQSGNADQYRHEWYSTFSATSMQGWDDFIQKYPEKALAYADRNPDIKAALKRREDRQKAEQEARQKRANWEKEIIEQNQDNTAINPEDITPPEDTSFIGPVLYGPPEDFGEDIPMDWHDEEDEGPAIDDTESDDDSEKESSGSNLTDNIDKVRKLNELGEEAEGAEAAVAGGEAAVAGTEAAATSAEAGAIAGEAGAAAVGAEGAAAGGAIAGAGGAGAAGAAAATTTATLGAEGAAVGAAATSEVWVPILVIAGVILLFLIIVIVVILHPGIPDDNGAAAAALLKITKTGPTAVDNPTDTSSPDLPYTINVSYPGVAQDVLVTDPLPQGTRFVSATEPYTTDTDASGNITAVHWSLAAVRGTAISPPTNTSTTSFDQQKFNGYGFPTPQDPDPVSLMGNDLTKWQQDMLPQAEKVSGITGVDIGILGMWPFIEGIHYNQFYDNCNDGKGASGDYNPNTPCPVDNWQVGYGVRPMEQYTRLQDALSQMHPGETVQQVGQEVLDESKTAGTPLTYPDNGTFPDVSIDQITKGAKNGDPAMRARLGTLMMDKGIGTYILGKLFQGSLGPNLASTMEGWDSSYYARQKVINYVKAIYDAGINTTATTQGQMLNQTLTLVLQPLTTTKDTYLVNQATAELVGASSSDTSANTTTTSLPALTGNTAANTSTCNGKYTLTGGEHNGQNFGDPTCELAQSQTSEFSAFYPVDPTPRTRSGNIQALLKTDLNQLDPANADKWQGIALCESGYDPNAVADAVNSTAYGLFQMAGGSVGNGQYDKGDVQWRSQASNAIDYNNKVLRPLGLTWKYWECAKWLGLWSASSNQ